MTHPPLRATLLLLGAATLLSACGSDGRSDATRFPDGTVRVDVKEYAITPQKLAVTAGRVKIVLHNSGRLPHNVKVMDRSRKDGSGLIQYGGTATIPGGTSTSIVLRLFPGHYRLADSLGSNENLGTYAELYVQPRSSS